MQICVLLWYSTIRVPILPLFLIIDLSFPQLFGALLQASSKAMGVLADFVFFQFIWLLIFSSCKSLFTTFMGVTINIKVSCCEILPIIQLNVPIDQLNIFGFWFTDVILLLLIVALLAVGNARWLHFTASFWEMSILETRVRGFVIIPSADLSCRDNVPHTTTYVFFVGLFLKIIICGITWEKGVHVHLFMQHSRMCQKGDSNVTYT